MPRLVVTNREGATSEIEVADGLIQLLLLVLRAKGVVRSGRNTFKQIAQHCL